MAGLIPRCLVLGLVLSVTRVNDDVTPIRCGTIERVYRLSPNLYSGSRPESPDDLKALAQLGIRTVVSVDGIAPDLDAARSAGVRYIHIPMDYGALDPDAAARIIRAVEAAGGPVFIHCHHGKYRGPSAAAIAARAVEGWNSDRVTAWLATAGLTPEEYPDLHASVTALALPTRETLDAIDPATLPERALVPDLVERMVRIDALWDEVQHASPDDAGAAAVARQLADEFREAARSEDAGRRGDTFVRGLEAAGRAALALESAWRGDRDGGKAPLSAIRDSCTQCHTSHRNRQPVPSPAP